MKNPVIVRVNKVEKSFKLPHEKNNSLKSLVLNFWSRKKGFEVQHALRGISFDVREGDFFGIVGRNGSGKSTLLKIISGIYYPDEGEVSVKGRLVPFIELGVGFNPELSGRENVFLNGALLGFGRKEMEKMYDDIVKFAELERFMDQKLKNYSSGMQVRLAFSVAIKAQADILVLDEVLAVGDSAFQQKCFDYFSKLRRDGKTVILVTHSMAQVERFCNRAILIEGGKILESGSVSKVTNKYENLFIDEANKSQPSTRDGVAIRDNGNFDVDVEFYQDNKQVSTITALKPFTVRVKVNSYIDMEKLNVGLNIRDSFSSIVTSLDARTINQQREINVNKSSICNIDFVIDNYYTNGKYYVDLIMVNEAEEGSKKLLVNDNSVASFQVSGIKSHVHGMFHPNVKMEVSSENGKNRR